MLSATKYKALGVTCVAVWMTLIVVGLWPLNFSPRNNVEWLGDRNGIRFAPEGQIYSTGAFRPTGNVAGVPNASGASFSIELRLQPTVVCGCLSAIVSFYDPTAREDFRIEQSIGDLVVRGRFRDSNNQVNFKPIYVPDVFQKGQERFVTLTSGPEGTAIYLESKRSRFVAARLEPDNFSGRLLVGHSAAGNKPWSGSLLGLAIYDRALSKEEVLQHYALWSAGRTTDLATTQGTAALYPFDERQGELIHNHAPSGLDLIIPAKFHLVRTAALELPLKFHHSDIKDAAINIFGFVPFGILVAVYLRSAADLSKSRAILLTIILGGMTSLLIELAQVYLPSRDSSSVDLINNILGTVLGTLVLKWRTRIPREK